MQCNIKLSIMIYELIKKTPALADALKAFNDGLTARAAELCAACIEKGESTAAALLLRSMCHAVMGRMDDAIYDNGRALALLSLSGSETLSFAQSSMEYGLDLDYCATVMESAGRELEKQSELSPGFLVSAANAYNCAGIARYRAGSPLEQENADFVKARELMTNSRKNSAPDEDERLLFAMIDSNLAECCFRKEEREQCRELFEESSNELLPDIYKKDIFLQHYSYCQSCLFELDRGEGSNVDAHKRISELIKKLEHKKGALTRERGEMMSAAYTGRSVVRYQMGDYSGAVGDCTKAIGFRDSSGREDEQLSMLYYNRAEAYEQLGELKKAVEDYERSCAAIEGLPGGKTDQAIGLRKLMKAGCCERLKDYGTAAESYRSAAEKLEGVTGDVDIQKRDLIERIDNDTAVLCHFRSGKCMCNSEDKDYHTGFTEQLAAFRLLDSLEETPLNIAKKIIIADSLSELYELFDEYDEAGVYYRKARELEEQLDSRRKDEILAAVSRMLDPFGSDVYIKYNASADMGEASGYDFVFADEEDDDEDEDGGYDDEYDEYDDGYDDYDEGDETEDPDRFENGEVIFASEDGFGDDGKQAAEEQEQLDDEDKVWKYPSDSPPEG